MNKTFAEHFSVETLTLLIKGSLESTFDDVWVVGETSGVNRPRSGHCYLTLKDEAAQLPAVIWKSSMSRVKFDVHDGLMLLCHGHIEVYPPHGKYQLVIDRLEPLGQGTLELAFRQLHAKLDAEGLFDPEKKRPLPKNVKRIALITSPTGAAIRDFLQILHRRTKRIDVLIVPVKVQGEGASAEIASAIKTLNETPERDHFDCIVVTRGGGSLEDLWAFNEEPLVRAVAKSTIPTVSAVGHEIDVTLCDLAADFRALTPSEAAERLSSDDHDLSERLTHYRVRLDQLLKQKIELLKQKIKRVEEHHCFVRPKESIVFSHQRNLDLCEEKLQRLIKQQMETVKNRVQQISASLEALNPLAVLKRGYSLTFDEKGKLVKSAANVASGTTIETIFAEGKVRSVVCE